MTPSDFKEWIDILSKPGAAVIVAIIIILYREAVIHIINTFVDVIGSYLKRK